MNGEQPAVRALHRHLAAVLALRRLVVAGSMACLAWGIAALVLRFAGASVRACLIAGSLGCLTAIVIAAVRAMRAAPSPAAVAALLDARLQCGGLVAASTTVPLGQWPLPLASGALRIRWDARPKIATLAASIAFVAGSLLVPMQTADARRNAAIGDDVRRVEGRVDLLKEEKLISADRAETFRQTLENLQKNTAGDETPQAWETLDAIDAAVSKIGADAGEEAIRNGEALDRTEALAGALDGSGLDASTLANGMRDLAAEASRAGGENGELLRGLSPEARAAIEKNAIAKSDLRSIAAAARAGKSALRNTLAKLGKGRLLDPKTLRRFDDAASSTRRDELSKFLHEHRGPATTGLAECRMPGRGGVDRGRGDAAMWFGDKSAENDARFKERVLPPAAAAALADSDLAGVSAAAPDTIRPAASAGGAIAAPGGAASAFAGVVLPRHRGTVSRFFERKPR